MTKMNQNIKNILEIINNSSKGSEAKLVGGCVRDYLFNNFALNFDNADIDIATNLTPAKITELFESKNIRVVPTGIEFGTVTVVYQQKNYEITTLRSDIATDGRHAKVSFTTDWLEDAKRRDFTFNALYMDIDGKIYDYFNGQEDLKNGVVRFIGNAQERISEDYLRILRLFRFHAYFGKGEILTQQVADCKILKSGLDKISGERIRTEMTKLLTSYNCYNALKPMLSSEVLQQITSLNNSDFTLEDVNHLHHFLDSNNPIVTLISILNLNISEEKIEVLNHRLKLSNKEKSFINRLQESLLLNFEDDYQVRKSTRINGKEEFYDYIILNYAKGRLQKNKAESLIKFAKEFAIPDFPIKSSDLFEMGIKQGDLFGKYLRKAEEIWEKSNYNISKSEIIEKVKLSEL